MTVRVTMGTTDPAETTTGTTAITDPETTAVMTDQVTMATIDPAETTTGITGTIGPADLTVRAATGLLHPLASGHTIATACLSSATITVLCPLPHGVPAP